MVVVRRPSALSEYLTWLGSLRHDAMLERLIVDICLGVATFVADRQLPGVAESGRTLGPHFFASNGQCYYGVMGARKLSEQKLRNSRRAKTGVGSTKKAQVGKVQSVICTREIGRAHV